ncbi:MAG: hypothetical protein WBD27_19785 [Pyrinomonadaceae bacterium]
MRINFEIKVSFLLFSLCLFTAHVQANDPFHYHSKMLPDQGKIVKTQVVGGIKEVISSEFQGRYNLWKQELLSTEFGRTLWAKYKDKKDFILTIKVTGKESKGAATVDFLWTETGLLAGATINLGSRLERGFPSPIYYPVMSSISEFNQRKEISGTTVAATKFAHEFGHVDLTILSNHEKVKLENQLIPLYNAIFLKNGFDTNDRRLIDMANEMGGTPIQIWENREYWGEATAMSFILEKTGNTTFHCDLIGKITDNVSRYSKEYAERFTKISESNPGKPCSE